MDTQPTEITDLTAKARERVLLGPAPDWVTPCAYDPDFQSTVRGSMTYLLIERQINAELRQTYERVATRLETMQAVQHQSQWRLEFEPQTQSIVLHSVKIQRGGVERELASLAHLQFLRREGGLEGLVVDGWITLLLVLEDVRPGDILEWSYTVSHQPRLLPEHFTALFFFPVGVEIGKYLFTVRSAAARKLKWRSQQPEFAPKVENVGDEVHWTWGGKKVLLPEPEQFALEWQYSQPLIEISDCPDWQTVAHGVLRTWKEDEPGDGLKRLAAEIESAGPDMLLQIQRAIETVQDQFRYLSIDLELGGQIPAPAETVIRRRYGDCKDVAFLLVRLLHLLGVSARPVLVNSRWRASVVGMLPSPNVFNHAVVEFEVGNEKRWVDATAKWQGGNALTRLVSDFGVGLPIDSSTSALAPVPTASLPVSSYELRETFALDTLGNASTLGINIIARGLDAEALRRDFENDGLEAIARRRVELIANRFSRATRVGQLLFRDNREQNEFEVAEAFQIDGFLKPDSVPESRMFIAQSGLTGDVLPLPSTLTRSTPMALPFPCDRVHTIEIHHNGLQEISVPIFNSGNKYFSFSRRCRSMPKFFKATFSIRMHANSMLPEALPEHRKRVEEIWQASMFSLHVPVGFAAGASRAGLGQLSTPARKTVNPPQKAAIVQSNSNPTPSPNRESPSSATSVEGPKVAAPAVTNRGTKFPNNPKLQSSRSRSRVRRMNSRSLLSIWLIFAAIGIFVFASIHSANGTGREFAAVFVLAIIALLIASLVLSFVGYNQSSSFPDLYPRGRRLAIFSLIFSASCWVGFLGLGVKAVHDRKARFALVGNLNSNSSERLKFDAMNFNFDPPPPPWLQTDARTFGRGAVLAFIRPEPMYFCLSGGPLEADLPDPRVRVVELCKSNILAETTSYQLISEKEVIRKGLSGWQMEGRVNIQGREFYMFHWIFATNGFGYQFIVWGPAMLSSDIKKEADALILSFQPTK